MNIELYVALAVGSALSLLFTERFHVLPAGLIVPGYLALLVERPFSLLATIGISLLTLWLVRDVIGKVTILYGRRKFVAMLLMGIALKLLFDGLMLLVGGGLTAYLSLVLLNGVGIIVPGLIANTMERQGVRLTLGVTALLTMLTWFVLFLFL